MRQDPQLLTPDTHRYSLPAWYRGSGWAGSTHLLSRSYWRQTGESRWGQFCAEQCPPLFQVTFSTVLRGDHCIRRAGRIKYLDGPDLAKVTQLVRVARASNPGLPATLVVFPTFCTAFNVCHMYIYFMLPSGPLSKYFFEGCLSGFSCTLQTESPLGLTECFCLFDLPGSTY